MQIRGKWLLGGLALLLVAVAAAPWLIPTGAWIGRVEAEAGARLAHRCALAVSVWRCCRSRTLPSPGSMWPTVRLRCNALPSTHACGRCCRMRQHCAALSLSRSASHPKGCVGAGCRRQTEHWRGDEGGERGGPVGYKLNWLPANCRCLKPMWILTTARRCRWNARASARTTVKPR